MLFEMAIGDAYGAAFEYVSRHVVDTFNDVAGYKNRDGSPREVGIYTDDTQMSIAITEAMFDDEGWNKRVVAQRFVQAFKRDPRGGYATSFGKFLEEVADADEFLNKINSKSDKSGGAMRAAPLGVIKSLSRALEACALQASITHGTVDGINAALATTAMSHYFVYDIGPKADLGKYLESVVQGQWSVPYLVDVGPKGWMSVRAAITAISECNSMSSLLKRCISFGGDVDTVAAIAMAVGSMSKDIQQDLPKTLIEGLESGPFGTAYLKNLDEKLMRLKNEDQIGLIS